MSRAAKSRTVAGQFGQLRHPPRECGVVLVAEADPDGRQVEHRRVRDVLDALLAGGVITSEMYEAGRRWQQDFIIGALHTMPMSRLVWSPGRAAGAGALTDQQCAARRRLADAIAALGGFGAPTAAAVWYVLGAGMALNDYARHTGWNGRRLDWGTARGILIGAVAVLAAFYADERRAANAR